MSNITLSKADSKVLSQVFDPESSPAAQVVIDPYLPADQHIRDPTLLSKLQAGEKEAIRLIEDFEKAYNPNPTTTPSSDNLDNGTKTRTYQIALSHLNDLINTHPLYASALNNRAQLHRWRYGDRGTIIQPSTPNNSNTATAAPSPAPADSDSDSSKAITSAIHDLRHAIKLTTPPTPTTPLSPPQARLLAQAHTQLAAIYYSAWRDLEERPRGANPTLSAEASTVVSGWSQEVFEEEGSRNFHLGGLYGNEVARQLAVATNPHAKLCGRIVKEAMRKEIAGES
ncbi:hypothetical protein MBLNU230_g4296t1 [Neophaeotheca triangularis]